MGWQTLYIHITEYQSYYSTSSLAVGTLVISITSSDWMTQRESGKGFSFGISGWPPSGDILYWYTDMNLIKFSRLPQRDSHTVHAQRNKEVAELRQGRVK